MSVIIAQKKLFAQNFFTRYDGGPINQLEYRMEFHIRANSDDSIFVQTYDKDDKSVFLSMYLRRANMSVLLTKEQAQELIAALQQVTA